MKAVGAGMSSVGKKMSIAVTAPLLLMGKIGVDELRAIEKANAQTSKALEQIGKKSLVSVGGVQRLAEALQKKSGIDDQAIQSGANMILQLGSLDTKTKAGAKAFDTATRAMVGFADFTGTDAVSAGKLFGKTLAAASQGTLLLPRGVKLSGAAMKDLERKFKAATTGAEKQKVVAEALGKRFTNLAKLTPTEKIDLFKDKIAGLAAGIISRLMPAIDPIANILGKVAGWFDKLSPTTQKWIAIVAVLAAALGPVLIVAGMMVTAIGALAPVLAAVATPAGAVVVAFIALAVWLTILYKKSATFRAIIGVVIAAQMRLFKILSYGPLGLFVRGIMKIVDSLGGWKKALETVRTAFMTVFAFILDKLSGIFRQMAKLPGPFKDQFKAMSRGMKQDAHAMRDELIKIKADADVAGRKVQQFGSKIRAAANTGKVAFAELYNKVADLKGALQDLVRREYVATVRIKQLKSGGITNNNGLPVPGFTVPKTARGGVFNGSQVREIAEAGAEAVVPLGNKSQQRRDRARVMAEAGLSGGGGITINGPIYVNANNAQEFIRSFDGRQRAYSPRRQIGLA